MIREGLTFDDLLLVPQHSTIESRSKIDISVKLGSLKYRHPIIPANMKTVISPLMAEAIAEDGGLAILHRFDPLQEQIDLAEDLIDREPHMESHIAVSVGVKDVDKENIPRFIDVGVKMFCIDVAHGDSQQCMDMVSWIKTKHSGTFIIAGNVATGAGADRLWRAGANVVKVGVGPGCFAAGTRILMANGFYKNIEDVNIGDYVINKNGKPIKVLDAFSTGIRKVSKLKNNIFYEDTYVTSDHNFWVGDLNSTSKATISNRGYSKLLDQKSKTIPKQSKYKWKEISQVKHDVLLIPNKIHFVLPDTFSIPLLKRNGGNSVSGETYINDSNIIPSYSSGYLFGTFLGDGNASCTNNNESHSGCVKWHFGLEEKEIATKLLKCIENIFNKSPIISDTKNTTEVTFYYKPLADLLNTWGKRHNKKMPEELLVSNKEYLQGIYDGLLDSDGTYNLDGRKTLVNTSINIIELFNIVSYLLTGIFPNNLKNKITAGGLKNCNIDNCHQPYISSVLKRGKVRLTNDYQVVKILGYENTDMEVPVYDLTVDCDSHSFIANNMIVHNSLCTTRIETGNGVPQITALMDVAEAQKNIIEFYKTKDEPGTTRQFPFIADGGIKNSGDIVKSLCFADMVMVGNLFAGCDEAPGSVVNIDGRRYKEYVGSSTYKTNRIEGVAAMASYKGPFKNVLTKLLEGLESGCSYQGANNLTELKDNPQFIKISNAGLKESHPHDVLLK